MGNNDSRPAGTASHPPRQLPKWRRVLSIMLFCVALALLLPWIVLACGVALRNNSVDLGALDGLLAVLAYPAIILLVVAGIVRWHRNPQNHKAAPEGIRLQFSLRTLFVVLTVLGCWLGYEFNWIRQRHEFISHRPEIARPHDAHKAYKFRPVEAPGLLWIFGERGMNCLWFESKPSESEIDLAKELFPEAKLRSAY
jgi:hypothetical protein